LLPLHFVRTFKFTFANLPKHLVIAALYLVVLYEYTWVDKSEGRRVEADLAGKEEDVVHFVDLRVRAHIWWCPVADALDVHVLLKLPELAQRLLIVITIGVPNCEVADDFIIRNFYAHSDWRPQSELLDVFGVERFELGQVCDK